MKFKIQDATPLLFLLFFSVVSFGQLKNSYKEEAKWHYELALEKLSDKNNYEYNLEEAIRILHEIIDFYDPSFTDAYPLLIKLYQEKKDYENVKKIRQRYEKIKKIKGREEKPVPVYSGPDAKEINQLLKNLNTQPPTVRYESAEKLIKKGKMVVSVLIESISTNNLDLQIMSAYILGRIGDDRAVEPLLNLLKEGLPSARVSSAESFGEFRPLQAVPSLIQSFSDPYYNHYQSKFEVREAAADSLAKYGPVILTELVSAMKNKDEDIRWYTLECLQRMEPIPQGAINILAKGLEDKSDKVILSAVNGLTKIDLEKKSLILSKLNPLLHWGNEKIRYSAVRLSGRILEMSKIPVGPTGVKDNLSVAPLLGCLNDTDTQVVNESIKVLSNFKNKNVEQEILKIASDAERNLSTRWYAVNALSKMMSEEGLTFLIKALDDKSPYIRSAAALALKIPKIKTKIDKKQKKSEIPPGEMTGYLEKTNKILNNLVLRFVLDTDKVYEEARIISLDKAVRFLLSRQQEDGHFAHDFYPLGVTQMACLSILSYDKNHPAIEKAIKYMLKYEQPDGSYWCKVEEGGKKRSYTTSLAIMVLSATGDKKYISRIEKSIKWLKGLQNKDGGFGYYSGSRSDMSTTEFALVSLDKGYRFLGREKNDELWIKALDYIKSCQNKDSGFSYIPKSGQSTGSMTASGLIGLILCGQENTEQSVKKTLKWIEQNYTWEKNPYDDKPHHYPYYIRTLSKALYLTGQETVTNGQNKKHIWYEEVLSKLLKEQKEDGSWNDDSLLTAYYLEVLGLKSLPNSFYTEWKEITF